MPTTINRTPLVDDDGSGTTGTILNNAWQTNLYNQIDTALAAVSGGGLAPTSGTFLPAFGSTGGAITGATYGTQTGQWYAIGKLFHCYFDMTLSAKGTVPAGILTVEGLPVAPLSAGGTGTNIYWQNLASAVCGIQLYLSAGSTQVLVQYVPVGGSVGIPNADVTLLTNTSRFSGRLTYQSV